MDEWEPGSRGWGHPVGQGQVKRRSVMWGLSWRTQEENKPDSCPLKGSEAVTPGCSETWVSKQEALAS